ncbi:glutamate-gated chloride channel [Anopheles darlingi]|uniref:Glutamate-gated chloride channel n=1 Tax=Anopheles darlingi TaxID=43151 RepID=W5JEQ1_ANODA|nr:glutamate-gated chloride channel [Anopheles darlingi]
MRLLRVFFSCLLCIFSGGTRSPPPTPSRKTTPKPTVKFFSLAPHSAPCPTSPALHQLHNKMLKKKKHATLPRQRRERRYANTKNRMQTNAGKAASGAERPQRQPPRGTESKGVVRQTETEGLVDGGHETRIYHRLESIGRLKYLTLTEANRVWMPDLFFSNEKEGHFHNIIMPNVYIRIFPYGSVLYSIRISLTLACPMNLKLYPLDRQVCSLRMASYGWTTADLVFLWKEGDPVQVVKNLHLPRFTLEKFLTDYCNSKTNTGKVPPTGEYSCLKVDLLFKREFSYYLIQIYIPCCMLVIVSWVSFWLDQGAVPARVSLGVTTLLTMATQTSGINASLPPVSYTKAIDVWTGVCLTFVFGALLEFALVNYASRSADRAADMHRENMKKKRREMEQASLDAASDLLDTDSNATFAMKPLVRHPGDPMALEKLRQCEVHMQAPKRPNCCRSWLSKFPTRQCSRSKRIDVISRITFPLVFALFNLVYWSTYLFREEEED